MSTTPTPAQPAEQGEALKRYEGRYLYKRPDDEFCLASDVTKLESRLAEAQGLIRDMADAAKDFSFWVWGPWPKGFDVPHYRKTASEKMDALLQRAKQALEVRGS